MPENIPALRVVPPERHIRFGAFEVDSRAGELRKHGIKIRIGQQGFEILLMILKRPGEVVLREEIRQKLWPLDTVVEFDHSINAAIQKLRDALGESADNPRYVETLPRRGYRFIGTVELPPAEPVTEKPPPEAPIAQVAPRTWSPLIFSMATVLLGMLALAWLRPWEARAPVRNFTFSLSLGQGGVVSGGAVVSQDGSAVIYRTARGLAVRRLDSLEETPVYTQDGLTDTPSWSPDESQVLFPTGVKLIRLPLPNGPPAILWPNAGVTRGFSWGPDGTILVSTLSNRVGALSLVPAKGGDPVRVEVPGFPEGWFLYPEFLPDGKNILFASGTDDGDLGLYLATLKNGRITRAPILLRKNMTAGHYAPSRGGRLLYVQNDKLYAQKLNLRRGTLEGEAEWVVDGVYSEVARYQASFSVSRNGVLVWTAGRAGLAQLTWFNRKGEVVSTGGPPCTGGIVRLAPDEKHVLLDTIADHEGFGIVEQDKSGQVALPGLPAPLWMPDSSHILYSRKEGNSFHLLERAAEGSAEKELARVPKLATLRDVSTDGKLLLYKEGRSLYSVRLDGSLEIAKPQLVAETMQGQFSPDFRWVVYSAVTTGSRFDVFVQPFPSGGLRTQLTSAGGRDAVWRGDGKEIIYRNGKTIYSIRAQVKGNTIHASPPEALFDVRVPAGLVSESMPLAVTRDGSRILFAQAVEQPNPQLTYVMTAWDTLLRR
jgi:DNA-binding winged helix-turn-helix (wHTH) protein/Tol biopolymer transport system component